MELNALLTNVTVQGRRKGKLKYKIYFSVLNMPRMFVPSLSLAALLPFPSPPTPRCHIQPPKSPGTHVAGPCGVGKRRHQVSPWCAPRLWYIVGNQSFTVNLYHCHSLTCYRLGSPQSDRVLRGSLNPLASEQGSAELRPRSAT